MGLNIRLTLLVVETIRQEVNGVNDMARSVKQATKAKPKFKGGLKRAKLANSLEAKKGLETRV